MKRPDEARFWQRASTAMLLIRDEPGITLRRLGAALGVSSHSQVEPVLKRLRREGYVTWRPGKARTLHLTRKGRQAIRLIRLAKVGPNGGLRRYA